MDSEPLVGGQAPNVKNASTEIRLGFVRKVYGILSAQLLLTFLISVPIVLSSQGRNIESWKAENTWMIGVALVTLVSMMCAMCCCMEALRKFPTNYIILTFVTVGESLMVGYTSALFTWQSVLVALGVTVGIFIAMTIFAWTTKVDFTGWGPYLFGAIVALSLFGSALLTLSLMGINVQMARMVYSFLAVLIFTFYIIFDTQMILGEWGGHKHQFSIDDYCFAALMLYLDLINLFLNLLELLGDRR